MKKLFVIIGLLIGCITGQAQIMPDSTVQICAYWTPGDKYAYQAVEEKLKIDEKGDTTLVNRESEVRTFEVLSQTKDKYLIRITYSDYESMDEEDQLINDVTVKASGLSVVEFETTETGEFIGVTNLDDLVRQGKKAVKPVMEALWERMGEERKLFSKKTLQKQLSSAMENPDLLTAYVYKDLDRMLFFHGARLDTIQVYEVEEQFMLPWGDGKPITGTTSLWIDSKQTDEYSAVCLTSTEIEAGEAVLSGIANLSQFLNLKKDQKDALGDSIQAGLKDIKARMEQFTGEEVHLETGVPLKVFMERTVSVSAGKRSSSVIVRNTVNLITEDDKKEQ